MEFTSYWMATAPRFKTGAEVPGARYDVVIVGAGFTGLMAARVLARAGRKVAVLEAGQVGNGASGRNGGHLNNGLAHDYAGAMARFGPDGARALYHSYDAAIDLVEATIEEERIDCDFRRGGKLKYASKPGHVAGLKASHALIRAEADPETVFLDRSELGAELQTEEAYAGMLYPKSAMMHVGRYLSGLAEAAARHGAEIFENHPVSARRREGEDWVLQVPHGEVRGRELVIATGAYSGQIAPQAFQYFRERVLPVGSFIVATRVLTEAEIAGTVPGDRNYVNSMNIGNYFRLSPDRRLIFGGRARFSARSDPQSDAISGRILRRRLEEMFPQLKGVTLDYCYGGLVDMTRDRLPRGGQIDGAWYAMGYSGHGVQISNLMGARLAQCIMGEGDNPLAGMDWPRIPGYRGRPWFLPITGLYFRLKDLLG